MWAFLLDTLPVAFVGHDASGVVTLWNDAATKLLGWSREEALGRPSPLPRELQGPPPGPMPAALRPVMVHRHDGSHVEVMTASMPMGPEGGATALWLAQSLSRDDEEKLKAMCHHAPDGLVVFDEADTLLEANPAACALLGYAEEELAGRTLSELAADALAQQVLSAPRVAGALTLEALSLRKKSGERVAVDLHAARFLPGRFVGFLRDVTSSNAAHTQLALFGRIFECSAEAILVTDAHNRIVDANRAFTVITGYTLEEVRGRNPSLLSSGRHEPGFYSTMWNELRERGQWQGELWNRRKSGAVYPEWATLTAIRDATGAVTHFAAIFSDISAVKRSEEQIAWLANHDHLTGLPNRALMLDRLTQAQASAKRDAESVALLLVNLDDFRSLNGSVGHQVGDEALKLLGRRLKDLLRSSDTVARMGGDEFALMLPALSDTRNTVQVVEKVLAAVAAPFTLYGHEVSLTASVGVALFPQDGDTAAALLRSADAAMYSARAAGRNTWRYFTDELNVRARDRLGVVSALSHALARNELRLHYQPQRDIAGKRLIGLEALLRWQRGDELWAPMRFIGIAEEAGFISSIGAWVIEEACRQAARWKLPVAVNVSVLQLEEPGFVELVSAAMKHASLDPALLELEITESVVMHEGGEHVDQLRALRGLGVKLAMDDFGTGYSSLSQLKRLPLTKLKIDRAFVKELLAEPTDRAVVQAVVTLGHALGLKVIAEGVEEEAQRAALETLGCDEVQGFGFGRPVEAARIDDELLAAAHGT